MAVHRPVRPRTPEPPEDLQALRRSLHDPAIARTGLTTTEDGEWALRVTVHSGCTTPLESVESQRNGVPVVYEHERRMPEARPAYPVKGE